MVVRLVTGIFAIVGVSLGVPFVILGLAVDDEFLVVGAAILVVGLALAAVSVVLYRREAELSNRRRNGRRVTAEVVDARLNPFVRVGVMQTVDLTVRIPSVPGGAVKRRVLLPPAVAVGPGDELEVFVDPDDPGNFEPVVTAERRLR